MDLKAKQNYYSYGAPGGWSYKQPPRLDPVLQKDLTTFSGTDFWGDPVYRFLWGGVAVVAATNNEQDASPVIRGSRDATKILNGRIQPKYLYGWQKEERWIAYATKAGNKGKVRHPDDLPEDMKLCWEEFKPVGYGKLRWFVERKLSAAQLVEALIYPEGDPRIPEKGGYIWAMTVETPDGEYFEPSRHWLAAIKQHVHEIETESMETLLRQDRARREAAERERELQPERDAAKRGDEAGFFASQLIRFNKNLPAEKRLPLGLRDGAPPFWPGEKRTQSTI